MLRLKEVGSPTLSAKGQFRVLMDEFAVIKREVVSKSVTGAATAGTTTISMTDTNGFAIGQYICIVGGGVSEFLLVTAVTPSTSLTTATNLVNTYTGVGATVTVVDVTLLITGTATAGGGRTIPMTNTTGMQAGQLIVIEDANGAETAVVNVVTTNTQVTVTANLVNTYTVAAGGRVTVVNGNPEKACIEMKKPFVNLGGAPPLGAEFIDCRWDSGVNTIVATVNKADPSAGPALPFNWGVAITADVARLNFAARCDGE
jgi:hypothetical protein